MANESEGDKGKLGIVLAIVAGLLAMGMVFVFLHKMKTQSTGGAATAQSSSLTTKSVLVATRDLPSGHVLSVNKDFKPMDIPIGEETANFAQQCVPASHARELEGRRLGVAIGAQYPLLFSNLVDSTRIDDDFTEGYLKTIEVSKTNLIGNQLIPGDRVVILATIPKDEEKESAAPAATPAGGAMDPAAMTAAILQSMPSMNPNDVKVETVTVLDNAEVFLVGSMRKLDRVQLGFTPAMLNTSNEITFRMTMVEALKLTQFENTPGAKLTLLLKPRKVKAEK
ncbi:MAG: CpaB family protein [Planctomycetota bacterium]|jgi:hypothetical protein